MDDLLDLGAVVGEDWGVGGGGGRAGLGQRAAGKRSPFGGLCGGQGCRPGLGGGQRGRQPGGDHQRIGQGRRRPGFVDHKDGGKDLLEGGGDGVDQGCVGVGAADVDDDDTVGGQVLPGQGKKFDCGEVEGNVGGAIGVDGDHIVAGGGGQTGQPATAVAGDRPIVGPAGPKKLSADRKNGWVQLDAGDRDRPVQPGVEAGHRACCCPDQKQIGERLLAKEGGQQKVIPDALAEQTFWVVDAVDADPFIEFEVAFAAPLVDCDIVERTFVFVEQYPAAAVIPGGADPGWLGKEGQAEHRQPCCRRIPAVGATPAAHGGDGQQQQRQQIKTPACAKGWDQPEHWQESAEQAACCGGGREPPCGLAEGVRLAGRQPQGPGGCRAQQHGGQRKERTDRQKGAEEQLDSKASQADCRQPQHRCAEQGNEGDAHGPQGECQFERSPLWAAIRQPAAEPGTGSQAEQDQADDGGPDQLAVAERRFQEPGGAQLHAQRGQPSGKDQKIERAHRLSQPEAIAAATVRPSSTAKFVPRSQG